MSSKNDSLEKELYFFRAKEDFYAVTVSQQSTHFEWLISTLLTAVGLISFGFIGLVFKYLKSRLETELLKLKKENDTLHATVKEVKIDFYKVTGSVINNIVMHSLFSEDVGIEEMTVSSTRSLVSVINYSLKQYALVSEEEKTDLIDKLYSDLFNLDLAFDKIDALYTDGTDKSILKTWLGQNADYMLSVIRRVPADNTDISILIHKLLTRINLLKNLS